MAESMAVMAVIWRIKNGILFTLITHILHYLQFKT